jgi:hypothetical protein
VETETHLRPAAEPLDPRLRDLYRSASPTQKLAAVARINATLSALKDAALAQAHPDWPAERRRAAVRRWWLTARD